MPLNPRPSHPSSRSYVLKLHSDAQPLPGLLKGRLENIASGHCVDFDNAQQLVEYLASEIDSAAERPDRSKKSD